MSGFAGHAERSIREAGAGDLVTEFITAIAQHRHWERELVV